MTPTEIHEIRMFIGVSQEKFAQMLGTTVVSVNRWENGKVTPSRLYIKEIKELRKNHGSYISRREEPKNS
jgi:putative transcriptional regulator